MFYSDCKQDAFAAHILNFLKNGTYLDIGGCHSIYSNNSFFFDNILDWRGICIEINSLYNDTYNSRKNCKYLNADATLIDYKKIFNENNIPNVIDYLSLDVDAASLTVLNKLPFNDFKFKVITIEHDAYLYGDTYRVPQRNILMDNGYILLCGNVYVEEHGNSSGNREFEDWWIHPDFFEKDLILKLISDKISPTEILNKFSNG
jgi:hypothetical protein